MTHIMCSPTLTLTITTSCLNLTVILILLTLFECIIISLFSHHKIQVLVTFKLSPEGFRMAQNVIPKLKSQSSCSFSRMSKLSRLFCVCPPKDETAFDEVFQKANFTTHIFKNRVKLETYNVSSYCWWEHNGF